MLKCIATICCYIEAQSLHIVNSIYVQDVASFKGGSMSTRLGLDLFCPTSVLISTVM